MSVLPTSRSSYPEHRTQSPCREPGLAQSAASFSPGPRADHSHKNSRIMGYQARMREIGQEPQDKLLPGTNPVPLSHLGGPGWWVPLSGPWFPHL